MACEVDEAGSSNYRRFKQKEQTVCSGAIIFWLVLTYTLTLLMSVSVRFAQVEK